jgi:hypothetical protein
MASRSNLSDDSKSKGNLRGVNEALDALNKSQQGTHGLVVYPDVSTLRTIYSRYTKIQLEDNNEIVVIMPYYETTDIVRSILSGMDVYNNNDDNNNSRRPIPVGYSGINVDKYEKEGSLIIVDSLKGYFASEQEQKYNSQDNNIKNDMGLMAFLDILDKHAKRRHKDGVTVLSDMGSFYYNQNYDHHYQKLMKYEISLPEKYKSRSIKGFCLYHQRDFEMRFSREQQAELLDSHSRNIMLVSAT